MKISKAFFVYSPSVARTPIIFINLTTYCTISQIMDDANYLQVNRESWNNRVETHLQSNFYDLPSFLNGRSSLNDIELNLMGNIAGKRILHLQCHFGQDSISLARMGALVTAVDLSDKAIEEAKRLATETAVDVSFICADVYDLPNVLHENFDIVFTSYGTIGWLPDLNKWAQVINHFLAPQGQLIFVEFHPVVWMFDDEFRAIKYNYFNKGAIIETEEGTYADLTANIQQSYVVWNHSLSEVFQSLLETGLTIEYFQEFDYSPYNCFKQAIEIAPNKFRIEHLGDRIPMVYALQAKSK